MIGVGNIGKAVLHRAAAWHAAAGNDISRLPVIFSLNRIEMLPLDDLLAQSDFVSVNCDSTPPASTLFRQHCLKTSQARFWLILPVDHWWMSRR